VLLGEGSQRQLVECAQQQQQQQQQQQPPL
jgi:hypothetical protein